MNVAIGALEEYDMRMWIIYVLGHRNRDPDRHWENDRFIALSLMAVIDFLSAFATLDLVDASALIPGDSHYVSCLTFRLGCVESRHSTGIDLRMILNCTVLLMRQELIDQSCLVVGLGVGIGSQNEEGM